MSENSNILEQLKDKAYREAFVFSQMSIPISFQIRALREQRKLTQKELAEKADMLQPRIVELERPKGNEPNLRTLGRLAAAFDVALIVKFVPFSELVEWAEHFSPDTFVVPNFDEDSGFRQQEVIAANVTETTAVTPDRVATSLVTVDYDPLPTVQETVHHSAVMEKEKAIEILGGIQEGDFVSGRNFMEIIHVAA